MGHLVLTFILLGCAILLIYWLWVYPCNGQTDEEKQATHRGANPGRVVSPPDVASSSRKKKGDEVILYALEIEPGTIVLQVGGFVYFGSLFLSILIVSSHRCTQTHRVQAERQESAGMFQNQFFRLCVKPVYGNPKC